MKDNTLKYLESLTKEKVLSMIKYGLRNSSAPKKVTVEDIYEVIGCMYIGEKYHENN